jgi:hypothetical protein
MAGKFKLIYSEISRGFPDTLAVLQPDHTWILAPVPEPYPKRSGVTVSNIKGVLQDLGKRR